MNITVRGENTSRNLLVQRVPQIDGQKYRATPLPLAGYPCGVGTHEEPSRLQGLGAATAERAHAPSVSPEFGQSPFNLSVGGGSDI